MSLTPASTGDAAAGDRYELRLHGHLAARWEAAFDGFTLTRERDGTTTLRGSVVDQAALHGVLHKVRDLGLPLLSVTRVPRTSHSHDQCPAHTQPIHVPEVMP